VKSLFVILIIVMVFGYLAVQEAKEINVTEAAENAFHKMHPGVADCQWEVEYGTFEAEIENGKEAVVFDEKGNFLFKETEIALSKLPSGCATYLSENFSGEKITEVSEVTDARSNKTFEVEVKDHDLIFDLAGNFIGEEEDAIMKNAVTGSLNGKETGTGIFTVTELQ
jgi:hypothetical protein